MFIDTHCHLSVEDYDNIDEVIKENRNNNISKIIVSGCSYDSIHESIKYMNDYDDVYLTIGYHPSEVSTTTDEELLELKELIKLDKVIGIGEIGLDYHYDTNDEEEQKKLFEEQLQIAQDNNLPVVIHSRDATKDTIDILSKYNVKGVIHCFSGSVETAEIYVKMGYKLGIGGVVTFKNSKLYQVVEKVGLDNIVLETDSPYLTPEPFRGTKNSSKYIPLIANKISEILGVSVEEVSNKTNSNVKDVFGI